MLRAPQNNHHPYTPGTGQKIDNYKRFKLQANCHSSQVLQTFEKIFFLDLHSQSECTSTMIINIHYCANFNPTLLNIPCTSFGSKLTKWSWLIRPRRSSGCPSCPNGRSYWSELELVTTLILFCSARASASITMESPHSLSFPILFRYTSRFSVRHLRSSFSVNWNANSQLVWLVKTELSFPLLAWKDTESNDAQWSINGSVSLP